MEGSHVLEGQVGGHGHAHRPRHVAHFPAFFGVARGIEFARRAAVALHAVLGDAHDGHVAENRLPVHLGKPVALRHVRVGVEGGERLGLVGVRRIVEVARVQVGEADGVVGVAGEQRRHRLAGNGAVQALVVVCTLRGIVDDVLVDGHELPHCVHFGHQHLRLLQHFGGGPVALVEEDERRVGRGKQKQDAQKKPDDLRPQTRPDLRGPPHAARLHQRPSSAMSRLPRLPARRAGSMQPAGSAACLRRLPVPPHLRHAGARLRRPTRHAGAAAQRRPLGTIIGYSASRNRASSAVFFGLRAQGAGQRTYRGSGDAGNGTVVRRARPRAHVRQIHGGEHQHVRGEERPGLRERRRHGAPGRGGTGTSGAVRVPRRRHGCGAFRFPRLGAVRRLAQKVRQKRQLEAQMVVGLPAVALVGQPMRRIQVAHLERRGAEQGGVVGAVHRLVGRGAALPHHVEQVAAVQMRLAREGVRAPLPVRPGKPCGQVPGVLCRHLGKRRLQKQPAVACEARRVLLAHVVQQRPRAKCAQRLVRPRLARRQRHLSHVPTPSPSPVSPRPPRAAGPSHPPIVPL